MPVGAQDGTQSLDCDQPLPPIITISNVDVGCFVKNVQSVNCLMSNITFLLII